MVDNSYFNLNLYKYEQAQKRSTLVRRINVESFDPQDISKAQIYTFRSRFEQLYSPDRNYLDLYQTLQREFPDSILSDFLLEIVNKVGLGIEGLAEVNRFYFNTRFHENLEALDLAQLEDRVEIWRQNFRTQVNQEKERYEQALRDINLLIDRATNYPPVDHSSINLKSISLTLHPTTSKGQPVDSDQGLDIFNRAQLSINTPFLAYREHDDSFYAKVWTGQSKETEPNYQFTTFEAQKMGHSRTLYLVIWMGNLEGDTSEQMHHSPQDSFQYIEYSLVKNNFQITIRVNQPEKRRQYIYEALMRVKRTFPFLIFDQEPQISLSGHYRLYGVEFEDYTLADLLLNQPEYQKIFYMDENITPLPLRRRFDLYYRPFLSNKNAIHFSLWREQISAEAEVQIYVRIYTSTSMGEINNFIKILAQLMGFYRSSNYRQDLKDYYESLLPDLIEMSSLQERFEEVSTSRKKSLRGAGLTRGYQAQDTNIRALRQQYPEIFVKNYSGVCQKGHTPVIIPPEEIEQWKQNHQLMNYPPRGDKIFTFTCPDQRYPYPGLQPNYKLTNRDKYPYLPCCFANPQTLPGRKTGYNNYMNSVVPVEKVSRGDRGLITARMLASRNLGSLPERVEELLLNYDPNLRKYVRMGIPRTPNSLIHSISIAIGDPDYLAYEQTGQAEEYVIYLRQMIATPEETHLGLVKQECFDLTDLEIQARLADPQLYLDPHFYYRALEEFFNINLYVFRFPARGEKTKGEIIIPRHKLFHISAPRDYRTTICLIEIPSEDPLKPYPQIELIAAHNNVSGNVALFDGRMAKICHSALAQRKSSLTLHPNFDAQTQQMEPYYLYRDLYNLINYTQLFNFRPISQYLDTFGKLRAITFENGSERSSEKMTLMILPSQPLNLPESSQIYSLNQSRARAIFGSPTGQGNLNLGWWYTILDFKEGFFVPISPTSGHSTEVQLNIKEYEQLTNQRLGSYPQLNYDPIRFYGHNETLRYERLQQKTSIFTQLLKWIYILASQDQLEKIRIQRRAQIQLMNPLEFMNNYTLLHQGSFEDSLDFYDFSQLPRNLPSVENAEQGLSYLESVAPSLIKQDRILIYDVKFQANLLALLQKYNDLNRTQIPQPTSYLFNYYVFLEDFKAQNNVRLFTSLSDFVNWVQGEIINYELTYQIYEKINKKLVYRSNPYLYWDQPTETFYLIQNVSGGDLSRAQAVSQNWARHGFNTGFSTDPILEEEFQPYELYVIENSRLEILEDHRQGQTEGILQILSYEYLDPLHLRNNYASILRIL